MQVRNENNVIIKERVHSEKLQLLMEEFLPALYLNANTSLYIFTPVAWRRQRTIARSLPSATTSTN